MANINDYLLWRGDLKIDNQNRFNEIDSMILARFSYLIFDKIKMEEKETIFSLANKMKNFDNEEFRYNGDKELITYLSESERFKDLVVTDYIQINDKEIEKQFGAITIHISNFEMYVSYLGTDSTIFGWKEDFNMSFMDSVPCQVSGKEYLEKVSRKYPYKKIRVGGHSKGGNVAIYSAITVPNYIQERIIKVYNYDGPGFSQNIINKYVNDKIINRIETYIPQDSVIGRILYHKERIRVIHSIEKGILEHDIFSWQVLKDNLIELEKNTEASEDIDKTITQWLETTTPEQRRIFIDLVFELFYSTEANTFGEMSKNFTTNLPIIMKKYNQISKEEKEVMSKMIKIAFEIFIKNIKEREMEKIELLKTEYKVKGKEKLEDFERKYKKNKSK